MGKPLETERGDLPGSGDSPVLGTPAALATSETAPKLALPAAHWSKRAEEARTLADQAVSPEISRSWLSVAESYDFLARQAEARARAAEALAARPDANGTRLKTERGPEWNV